jgi:hypothetical protein
MGWSLTYREPKEPKLLEQFFLSIGKALYLASSFESKCQYVLRIVKIGAVYDSSNDVTATMALAKTLKDQLLGATIRELKNFPEFGMNDVTKLERAKDARNYIAHESTNIGMLCDATSTMITEKMTRLRLELENLTIGDNLVSRWVYEIDEKEPAPLGIQEEYPNWVVQWVFGRDSIT